MFLKNLMLVDIGYNVILSFICIYMIVKFIVYNLFWGKYLCFFIICKRCGKLKFIFILIYFEFYNRDVD